MVYVTFIMMRGVVQFTGLKPRSARPCDRPTTDTRRTVQKHH
jgi:hypothetical protein